jgi:vitamin B12 transporter
MRKLLILSSVSLFALMPAGAETVVVSATRSPQPLEVTGTSVSVITANDLALQQTTMLSDALASTPGVTVVRNGGVGQNTNILLRGAEAGQTLVLVDGIRINDPSATTGFALMGDVLANGIERVEILRGPQSTLYGSDAIGGVVNILTTRGGEPGLRLTAEGGSFDTVRVNAAANGTYQQRSNSARRRITTSPTPFRRPMPATATRKPTAIITSASPATCAGMRRMTVSVDARVYYTTARDSYDGYPPPTLFASRTRINTATTNCWRCTAASTRRCGAAVSPTGMAIIHSDSDRTTFDTVKDFYGKGGATRYRIPGRLKLDANNELTFGAEDQRTSLDTESLYDRRRSRAADRIDGVYAQLAERDHRQSHPHRRRALRPRPGVRRSYLVQSWRRPISLRGRHDAARQYRRRLQGAEPVPIVLALFQSGREPEAGNRDGLGNRRRSDASAIGAPH